ncbi:MULTISPECIES: hypothetical protein [unclassified Pseudomonas]|uniref:hypothetical protein n=1 Tax=unclassified Pseudomonas TaxID=196821 RepID=UPI000624F1CE|nr:MULTISPECIES: hypothetical protein [unclassified Pseudomonas]TFF33712.1 hypothetical protein E3U47_24665 [Pseudomonas sp. RIT623]CRI57712.1 hypothetical protein CCOS191_3176 [Pseudomonas sp. CCOS 191]
MSYLTDLEFPAVEALIGGDEESAWVLDRERKVDLIVKNYGIYSALSIRLLAVGGLYRCNPEILLTEKHAADWYISLAGYSIKTLRNLSGRCRQFGLNRRPEGMVKKLREGGVVLPAQMQAFSDWVNFEIDSQFAPDSCDDRMLALSVVLMILGGRIIGQSQNIGGNDAVDILKALIIQWFEARGRATDVEVVYGLEEWVAHSASVSISEVKRIRISGVLFFEFVSGGDRPDVRVFNRSVEVAVGEIKGRKDLSNAWESWLPGLYNHLRTWAAENIDRGRLFFGTLISEEMVTGKTSRGTTHNGLKAMKNQGLLQGAFNLSNIVSGVPHAVEHFDGLMKRFDNLIALD